MWGLSVKELNCSLHVHARDILQPIFSFCGPFEIDRRDQK